MTCPSHQAWLLAGLLHELPQCNRNATWLPRKPVPMAGEQGDLTCNHAQAWPAWPWFDVARIATRRGQDVPGIVLWQHQTGLIVNNDAVRLRSPQSQFVQKGGYFPDRAAREPVGSGEYSTGVQGRVSLCRIKIHPGENHLSMF